MDRDRIVRVTVEPDHWLDRIRRLSSTRVEAAGLTDGDIDRLIDDARAEVWQERRAGASSRTGHLPGT